MLIQTDSFSSSTPPVVKIVASFSSTHGSESFAMIPRTEKDEKSAWMIAPPMERNGFVIKIKRESLFSPPSHW